MGGVKLGTGIGLIELRRLDERGEGELRLGRQRQPSQREKGKGGAVVGPALFARDPDRALGRGDAPLGARVRAQSDLGRVYPGPWRGTGRGGIAAPAGGIDAVEDVGQPLGDLRPAHART